MKALVREGSLAVAMAVVLIAMTSAPRPAQAWPKISLERVAQLNHFETKVFDAKIFGVGVPILGVAGLVIAAGFDAPLIALLAVAAIPVGIGFGLYTYFHAKHQLGTITPDDQWFLNMSQLQRRNAFPGYYGTGANVARSGASRGGGSPATIAAGSAGSPNMGMHH